MTQRHRGIAVGLLGLGGLFALAFLASQRTPAPGHRPERFVYRFSLSNPVPSLKSIEALEQRLATTSGNAFDLAELATLYFQRGRETGETVWLDRAEETARRSLSLLPSPNPARLTLAKVADARHRFREAIAMALEVLKDRSSTGALGILISSHLALGEVDEAAHFADLSIERMPDLSSYLQRALVLQTQGRDDEAAFDFERAAQAEDVGNEEESARLRSLWARFLLRRGDYANADRLLRESLRIRPENHLALAIEGELELRRGSPVEAQRLFMAAFTGSRQVRYLRLYARAKAEARDSAGAEEARGQAEKLLRQDLGENGIGHRLDLAQLLVDRGRSADLQEAVKLCNDELGLRKSPELYATLSRALFGLGQLDPALSAARAALRFGTRDPEYYELAARTELAVGNRPRAQFYSDLALSLDRSYRPAEETRLRLKQDAVAIHAGAH